MEVGSGGGGTGGGAGSLGFLGGVGAEFGRRKIEGGLRRPN